jgi:hypothetical protein
MQLKNVNESLEHRISGGSAYQWKCYGENARYIDYESEYATGSCVADTKTQEVYEATIEFKNSDSRPYRWLNPDYKDIMYEESLYRHVDANEAWDAVKWIDLETEEDWHAKACAIFNGEDFDERISVPLTLTDDEMFRLMKLAHEKDITLNQLMVEVLTVAIAKHTNE